MVQVNGKLRGHITVDADLDNETAKAKAKEIENVAKFIAGKTIVKEIVVPNKIVNIVVK
jgi:leucyl-tRNA synthetase